mgnify:FL=1
MKITTAIDYTELSQLASASILTSVRENPSLFFCAATGGSPTGMYAEMAKHPSDFAHMRVMKMDEWGIIPTEHPDSCESYLKQHVLGPLAIPETRYFGFDTNMVDTDSECKRMQSVIAQEGPFDICILNIFRKVK